MLVNVLNDIPPFNANNTLIMQILDGLKRSVHMLPDHVRTHLNHNLEFFIACSKSGSMDITPTALLISIAPIIQEPPNFELEISSMFPAGPTEPAMLSDLQRLPDLRRITDPVTQSSTSSDPRETAFAAQLRDRQRLSAPDRYRPPSHVADGARHDSVRRDVRIDPRQDNVRRDSNREVRHDRHDVYGDSGRPRKTEPPQPGATLEDLQRTIASLQSQIDRQARKANQESSSKSNRLAFESAHMASAKTSSAPDDPDVIDQDYAAAKSKFYALGASTEYCSDDLPYPAGTTPLRCETYYDSGSD